MRLPARLRVAGSSEAPGGERKGRRKGRRGQEGRGGKDDGTLEMSGFWFFFFQRDRIQTRRYSMYGREYLCKPAPLKETDGTERDEAPSQTLFIGPSTDGMCLSLCPGRERIWRQASDPKRLRDRAGQIRPFIHGQGGGLAVGILDYYHPPPATSLFSYFPSHLAPSTSLLVLGCQPMFPSGLQQTLGMFESPQLLDNSASIRGRPLLIHPTAKLPGPCRCCRKNVEGVATAPLCCCFLCRTDDDSSRPRTILLVSASSVV